MSNRGVNKVILVGNLGADPVTRYSGDGRLFTTLSLCTSEVWKDKQTGEKRESTEWHRVVLMGKLAEIAKDYLRKGSKVYIEGMNKTRKWDDNGIDRYTTEVHGKSLQMLSGNREGAQSEQEAYS